MLKEKRKDILVGVAIIAVVALLSAVTSSSTDFLLARILIMMLFGTAVNIMFGYGGLVAFGQAIFFGFAAYLYTILARAGVAIPLAFLATVAGTIVFSFLIAKLVLRVSSLALGLLFLGLNMLLYNISNYVPWLGSGVGISYSCRPAFATGNSAFLWFVVVMVALCYVLLYIFLHSPFIRQAQGVRENEMRMTYIGVNVKRVKEILILVSGTFCGVAGILYAMLNSGAFVSYLNTTLSTQALIMCLVGGMFTFWGPSIGGVLITLVTVYVAGLTIYHRAVLGIILVLTIIFFPSGILGQNPDDVGKARRFFGRLASWKKEGEQ